MNPKTVADAAPKRPTAGVSGRTLRVSAALPDAPGAYVMAMSLTDRRFGDRFVASEPVAVFVPGARQAKLRLNVAHEVLTAGGDRPR